MDISIFSGERKGDRKINVKELIFFFFHIYIYNDRKSGMFSYFTEKYETKNSFHLKRILVFGSDQNP